MTQAKHTPGPYRIGDAGFTVFGPPNGNPSPEIIATVHKKANTAFIVRACNAHDELVTHLEWLVELLESGDIVRFRDEDIPFLKATITKAKGGQNE